MSIRSKINNLTLEQRRQLAHAFDQGFAQVIIKDDNTFVAVNIHNRNNFNIEEEVGVWTAGKIKR